MKYIKSIHYYLENLVQAKKILKDTGNSEDSKFFQFIRSEFKNNTGYIGWFTKMYYINKISIDDIKYIIDLIKNNKILIESLPKDLIKYDSYESLIDDIQLIDYNRSIKKVIDELPSKLKSKISIDKLSINDKNLLFTLYKNKDKSIFIQKISRYNTFNELKDALKLFLSSDKSNGYDSILKLVENSGAEIIHKSKKDDLIICKVNYNQVRHLGSDTSWCIVPSKSTFDSYQKYGSKQYIIFLTDMVGNYSKIGSTIGFDISTSHLKDDTYLSNNDLESLLLKRNFNIKDLIYTKKKFLEENDINDIDVYTLINVVGLSKDFILENKKCFKKIESYYFTKEELEKYDFYNKIEIENFNDFKKIFNNNLDVRNFFDNINRIKFKVDMGMICDIKPHTRYLDKFIDIAEPLTIKEINLLLFYKDKPLDLIKNYYNFTHYSEYKYKWDGTFEVVNKKSIEYLIYSMMISGVSPYNVKVNNILDINFKMFMYYDVIKLFKFLELNGFSFTSNQLFNVFIKVNKSTFDSIGEVILKVLKVYPEIKEEAREIIMQTISDKALYNTELKIIEDVYPDMYEKAYENSKIIFNYNQFKRLKPYKNFMNSENFLNNNKLTIKDIYDNYLNNEYLFKYNFNNYQEICLITTILAKVGKIDELSNYNINWNGLYGNSPLDMLIKICYGLDSVFKDPGFNLTNKEKKDIIKVLMTIDMPNVSSIKRHLAFSLVYYKENWGFNNYLKVVKNEEGNRIVYFKNILSYLIKNNKFKEAKDIIDEYMSWDDISKEEEKYAINYIQSSYELGNNIDDWKVYINKYYPKNKSS